MIGLPNHYVPINYKPCRVLIGKSKGILQWELDALSRVSVVGNVKQVHDMHNGLLEEMSIKRNMNLKENVCEGIIKADSLLLESHNHLNSFESARLSFEARYSIKSAVDDPSILALNDVPDQYMFAMYLPIFVPMFIQIILMIVKLFKTRKSSQNKPKTD